MVQAWRSQAPLDGLHREFWGQIAARGSVQAIGAQCPPARHSRSGGQLVGVHGALHRPLSQTRPLPHCGSVWHEAGTGMGTGWDGGAGAGVAVGDEGGGGVGGDPVGAGGAGDPVGAGGAGDPVGAGGAGEAVGAGGTGEAVGVGEGGLGAAAPGAAAPGAAAALGAGGGEAVSAGGRGGV